MTAQEAENFGVKFGNGPPKFINTKKKSEKEQ